MHIDAGRLRCRITFQRFDGACDAYGAPLLADDEHWAEYASAWAAVDPLSGREFGSGGTEPERGDAPRAAALHGRDRDGDAHPLR